MNISHRQWHSASNNHDNTVCYCYPLLRLLCSSLLGLLLSKDLLSLSAEAVIPPPEAASIVSEELLVVDVVVISTGPEGQEVVERPRELVAGVSVDGLEETENDPNVHGHDVEVAGDGDPDDRDTDTAEAKSKDFDRGGELSGETKRSRVLVVKLVDAAVEGTPVEGTVEPVVPGILKDKEDGDLVGNGRPVREGNGG